MEVVRQSLCLCPARARPSLARNAPSNVMQLGQPARSSQISSGNSSGRGSGRGNEQASSAELNSTKASGADAPVVGRDEQISLFSSISSRVQSELSRRAELCVIHFRQHHQNRANADEIGGQQGSPGSTRLRRPHDHNEGRREDESLIGSTLANLLQREEERKRESKSKRLHHTNERRIEIVSNAFNNQLTPVCCSLQVPARLPDGWNLLFRERLCCLIELQGFTASARRTRTSESLYRAARLSSEFTLTQLLKPEQGKL